MYVSWFEANRALRRNRSPRAIGSEEGDSPAVSRARVDQGRLAGLVAEAAVGPLVLEDERHPVADRPLDLLAGDVPPVPPPLALPPGRRPQAA